MYCISDTPQIGESRVTCFSGFVVNDDFINRYLICYS